MDALSQTILNRMQRARKWHVFTPKDFVDLARRATIDKALSRLTSADHLQRVGRGLYYLPRKNPRLGIEIPPDSDDLAQALGRQTGSRVVPSGAVAANRLGLSSQVPARPLYLSNGRTRSVTLAGKQLIIKHVPPKELPAGRPTSAMVFQALRYLGPAMISDNVIKTLRRALSAKEQRELVEDARYSTDWISETVRRVVSREGQENG